MKKFKTISRAKLHNEDHVNYYRKIYKAVDSNKDLLVDVKTECETFKNVLDVEISLLDPVRKYEDMSQIYAQDRLRCDFYRGILHLVKANLYSSDEDVKRAAKKLQLVLDNYKNIFKRSLTKKTAAIEDIIRELNDHHRADITKLVLKTWITDLENANNRFEDLLTLRLEEAAKKSKEKMSIARKETDKSLLFLFGKIEALTLINDTNLYNKFIDTIDAITIYFKNKLAQTDGHQHKIKNKSEEQKNEDKPTTTEPDTEASL